jgi:hypothetical protein
MSPSSASPFYFYFLSLKKLIFVFFVGEQIYAQAYKAADLRPLVQEFNMKQIQMEEEKRQQKIKAREKREEQEEKGEGGEPQDHEEPVARESKWNYFLEEQRKYEQEEEERQQQLPQNPNCPTSDESRYVFEIPEPPRGRGRRGRGCIQQGSEEEKGHGKGRGRARGAQWGAPAKSVSKTNQTHSYLSAQQQQQQQQYGNKSSLLQRGRSQLGTASASAATNTAERVMKRKMLPNAPKEEPENIEDGSIKDGDLCDTFTTPTEAKRPRLSPIISSSTPSFSRTASSLHSTKSTTPVQNQPIKPPPPPPPPQPAPPKIRKAPTVAPTSKWAVFLCDDNEDADADDGGADDVQLDFLSSSESDVVEEEYM